MTANGRSVNWGILLAGLATVIPLIYLLGTGFGNNPNAVPFALESRPAPEFELQTLDGTTFSSADLQGEWLVINFWSTWCRPCKVEHDLLQAAAKHYRHAQFLGVLYSDDADKAKRYLKSAGASYPTLVDPRHRMAIDYGVAGVPETYFVDPEGIIVYKHLGAMSSGVLEHFLGEKQQ